MSHSLLAPIAALVVAVAPVQNADFTGTFSGKSDDGTITLTLKQAADGAVSGELRDGDETLSLSGRRSDDGRKVVGKVSVQGVEIPFEIRRTASGVDFVMILAGEEEVVALARVGAAPAPKRPALPAPTAPKAAPKRSATPKRPAAAPAPAGVYRHPAGVQVALPAGWKIETRGAIPALLPPGATRPDGDELYLLLVGEAGGIRSADDPRLEQFVEALLNGRGETDRGILGGAVVVRRIAPGTWESETTRTGQTLYARCFFSAPDGRVAAILTLGLREKIRPREAALRAAMDATRMVAPEHDPRLVGDWSGSVATRARDARDSVGRQQASSVTDSNTSYRIDADGRFVQSRTSRTIAIGQGVSIDSGDQVERTGGTWSGSGGKIALCDENGLYALGTYRVVGNQVVLELADRVITLTRG